MKPEALLKAGFTFIAGMFLQQAASAQVKMGGLTPNAIRGDALLELNSPKQGLLLPRVNSAALTSHPLDTAANGLIIYVTDHNSLFVRKNATWKQLLAEDDAPASTVSSVNGGTGAVTFTAGTGLSLSGREYANDGVLSFNTRKGAVVAAEGDYTLTQLNDVTLSAPANEQLLQYNGTQWANWTPTYLKPVTTLTQGSVLFGGASGAVGQNNAQLFWDNTNNRLGIGTATPTQTLTVTGTASVSGHVGIGVTTAAHSDLTVNGSVAAKIRTITANTTPVVVADDDYTVVLSHGSGTGTIVVQLPNPTTCAGRMYVIKKNVANRTVNVTCPTVPNFERAAGPTTITGITTLYQGTANTNSAMYMAMTFQSDGTRWYMISN
ncbi:hypothetical protein MKQ68_16415 [Chitinophaga horti]|uniref:Uncharacterized protein n=1 Tax=Chitinophaga horti TaxID=2920382 RepID=A0ABY6J0A6_9BACT|nr:hypothetical protein [Chitinophaga horti]UYQ91674.1 hypothetical protein MKQ68_16415 [Chitinophaga horti]